MATYVQFEVFSKAGRKLADLHVNDESQPEYKGVVISEKPECSYRVSQMKYGKISGKKGNAAKAKTIIFYNEDITISNIPLEAQEYVINKKSELDWVVERACVSVDKASGIVNDFNDYGMEKEPPQPRYLLSLVLKVIREYQKFCVRGDFQRVATSHSFVFRTCVFQYQASRATPLYALLDA